MGQASAFAPNYAKAKISANRIFALLDRQPVLDNYDPNGQKLVSRHYFCLLSITDTTHSAETDIHVDIHVD